MNKQKYYLMTNNVACGNNTLYDRSASVITMKKPQILFLKLCLFFISTCGMAFSAWGQLDPPFQLPPAKELSRIRSAVINTNRGDILVELFPSAAPWHVANFKYLADLNYYNGTVVTYKDQQFVVQLGAASSKKESMLGYSLPPEFNDNKHDIGVLSMARPQDDLDPTHQRRSHPAQFNIILGNAHHMNGNYTVFGRVVRGLQVAQQLQEQDQIKGIIVFMKKEAESQN